MPAQTVISQQPWATLAGPSLLCQSPRLLVLWYGWDRVLISPPVPQHAAELLPCTQRNLEKNGKLPADRKARLIKVRSLPGWVRRRLRFCSSSPLTSWCVGTARPGIQFRGQFSDAYPESVEGSSQMQEVKCQQSSVRLPCC